MASRSAALIICTAAGLGLAGCGSASKARAPGSAGVGQVRAVAEAYLAAIKRGDGAAACRLLSPAGLSDGGYRNVAACAPDLSDLRTLGAVPIVSVKLSSPTTATVIVGDAKYSDSGNDSIVLSRYGSRWRIDTG
jgi:hypothetical protein